MTEQEQIDDLRARLQRFEDFFTFVTNPYNGQKGVMTQGRLGVMTDFWMQRPNGQGAALSVGTEVDRFGCYIELEATACPDHPTTGVFVSVEHANPTQQNIAFESHVAGSAVANVDMYVSGVGFEVGGPNVFMGQLGGTVRQLWPAFL